MNNHYFRKEFLYGTFFTRTFARIRQHYFSKYWGGRVHGPSPHLKFGGTVPPRSPPLFLTNQSLSYADTRKWVGQTGGRFPCRLYFVHVLYVQTTPNSIKAV